MADDTLPEISLTAYEKIDQWASLLDKTPILKKRSTFEAAAADLYETAQHETNLGAFQSIEDSIYTLGRDYAGLNANDINFIMLGAKTSAEAAGDAGAADSHGHSTAKKILSIESGELVRAADELRDILAACGEFYERGMPVCIAKRKGDKLPFASALTKNSVVRASDRLCARKSAAPSPHISGLCT